MRIARLLLSGVAAALLLAACGAPQTPPPAEPTAEPAGASATAPADSAYPGPAGASSAYPGPASPSSAYPAGEAPDLGPTVSSEPITIPQPSSSSVGVVHGSLFQSTDGGQRVPVAGYSLYLGEILKTSEGVEGLVSLDPSTAPVAQVNGLGQFVFTDVPPGRYGLMLETGVKGGQLLLNDPTSGGDFIIEIVGGDTKDLGELAYPFPEI